MGEMGRTLGDLDVPEKAGAVVGRVGLRLARRLAARLELDELGLAVLVGVRPVHGERPGVVPEGVAHEVHLACGHTAVSACA